ncbi:hypothetical protein BU592_11135 [Staphylococcus arlettae]|uniref:hypothetical protein n=1 Tax=Staphylococcus arlettae TaxID=29378 RepID=UPI000D1BE596|nr:hypothetical protein [Staphylococcus arlettae]PTH31643.1 hypothetical protein BU592_11135 [Staphylococcus arlettae]PTH54566.1 hypothetical protein BU599_12425 [Staphylococcus arlettae]RIM59683.1 hypothetical protein BU603_02645 [Staphylococcus arlettae]RIM62117.1 hypothetical protein BU604_05600 [Staphylococcus arlettae]
MIKTKFKLEKNKRRFIQPIKQFIDWIEVYREFNQNIHIIIHDYPILSYGYVNDCQIDMYHKTIYYSLYDIENDMKKNYSKKFNIDIITNVMIEVFEDLSLQLSKFYIINQENMTIHDFIVNYEKFEKQMYHEQRCMVYQFACMNTKYSKHLKGGLKITYDNAIPYKLQHAIELFEGFITEHMKFPIKTKVKMTYENLIDCDGYFKYPNNLFKYPKIKISLNDFECIENELGSFDAVLNILRILAHELGHYHAFVNGVWNYDQHKREIDAYNFENLIIQKFIDEVYYNYY